MVIPDLEFDTDTYLSIKWYRVVRKYHSLLVAKWENFIHNQTFLTEQEFNLLMIDAEQFIDDKKLSLFAL
jgi:hypothetical protein